MTTIENLKEKLILTEKFAYDSISLLNDIESLNDFDISNQFRDAHDFIRNQRSNLYKIDTEDLYDFEKSVKDTIEKIKIFVYQKREKILREKLTSSKSLNKHEKEIEELEEINLQCQELTDKYNKIAEKINYTERLGIISAHQGNDTTCYISEDKDKKTYSIFSDDAPGSLITNIQSKQEAEELAAKLELIFMENLAKIDEDWDYDNRPYASIYSSDRGWFPSGINC